MRAGSTRASLIAPVSSDRSEAFASTTRDFQDFTRSADSKRRLLYKLVRTLIATDKSHRGDLPDQAWFRS